jgi:general secretion pathway protein K
MRPSPAVLLSRRQSGVALAIVVWFLAAMSLMVSGIVFQSRVDIKLAQIHASRAKATAAADGAMQLMLGEFVAAQSDRANGAGELSRQFAIGEHQVTIDLVPVSGLIDIQQAPAKIISQLFQINGESEAGNAQQLAASVIKWREMVQNRQTLEGDSVPRLSTVEDLLRIDGVTRTHLDRLIDVVYIGKGGSAQIDLNSAPKAVLKLLAGDNERAASALEGRLGGSELRPQDVQNSNKRRSSTKLTSANVFRVDAFVSIGGQQWLRRRFVSMSGSGQLPWRYFRSEPVRVVSGV